MLTIEPIDKEKNLTFNEIKILYYIRSVKRYRGTRNHLQAVVNIEGGSFDPALDRLLGPYIEEVRAGNSEFLKLTEEGDKAIRFLRIPNYILPAMYFAGIVTVIIGLYTLLLPVVVIPLLSLVTIALGLISVAGATSYIFLSRRYAKEFLRIEDRPSLAM